MPTLLTDQRLPVPATLRDKLLALGADPQTLAHLAQEIELHHESIQPPQIIPDLDAEQEII